MKFDRDIQEVKKVRGRGYRRKTGLVIVEGYPEIRKAIDSSVPMKKFYICPELFTPTNGEFDSLPQVEVDRETFAAMAFGSRLKGVLAICQPQQKSLSDLKLKKNSLIVVLENVEKPGNLGAVLRTCDGAGVDAVIVCDGKTDIYNQHVVRSSIGTVFTVPVVAAKREETLNFIKENNIRIFAALSQGKLVYSQATFEESTAIIVGNEGEGLTSFWRDHADQTIKIPMCGTQDSLNVTVSASILIYEALRQRMKIKGGCHERML